MESFFALLQKSVIDRGRWATRDESIMDPTPAHAA